MSREYTGAKGNAALQRLPCEAGGPAIFDRDKPLKMRALGNRIFHGRAESSQGRLYSAFPMGAPA